MKLRYLILCGKNGVKTEPALQYLDEEKIWQDIVYAEMKTWEYKDGEVDREEK